MFRVAAVVRGVSKTAVSVKLLRQLAANVEDLDGQGLEFFDLKTRGRTPILDLWILKWFLKSLDSEFSRSGSTLIS